MKNKITFLFSIMIFGGLLLAAHIDVSAQGRGRGNSGGGAGQGNGGVNRPTRGVDGGLGTASGRSQGRSDDGLNNAGKNSNGRSDEGINRARLMRENSQRADREIRENPNLPGLLRTNANDLRKSYQSELLINPNLEFGQFVAANMVARNLNSRYPSVTTGAILDGLANGDSIGRTLKNLRVGSSDRKRAEREAKNAVKGSRNRD